MQTYYLFFKLNTYESNLVHAKSLNLALRYLKEFLEKTEKAGITVPITAGIMPMLSKTQVSRMIFMCGASLPSEIIRILNKYENDSDSLKAAGIEYAASQARDLLENGVDGIHLYTMNKPEIASGIMERLK